MYLQSDEAQIQAKKGPAGVAIAKSNKCTFWSHYTILCCCCFCYAKLHRRLCSCINYKEIVLDVSFFLYITESLGAMSRVHLYTQTCWQVVSSGDFKEGSNLARLYLWRFSLHNLIFVFDFRSIIWFDVAPFSATWISCCKQNILLRQFDDV